ncbi:MAG: DUF3857 and transglutaminase domain-containing protein [Candidatus Gorgyraea atricola]|nr:DUF3857 and transglutaminase domain-containing protein [Candidatus Gorgyraea atricola]
MVVLKFMRFVLIIIAFLATFFPIYINISAFAIEPDEEDAYIVLLDESRKEIHEDGSYTSTIHVKYKILKEDALDWLGEKEIDYLSVTEKVEIIKALVIKPNGRKIRAKKIQDVSPYSGYPSYTDLKTKIITMRDMAVDDVLEFKYKIIARHSKMPGQTWGTFYFFDSAPMDVSRFILTAPVATQINIKSENLDIEPVITYSKDGATKTYTWERKDCPKVEQERMMPSVRDFCPYLTYSTIDDWQEIAIWFWDIAKDKMFATPQIAEAARGITASSENKKDKIRALMRYFQDNIRYVSMSFGLNAFEPHPAHEVFENKYGDCKDQAVLLIAMLKSLGIDGYPVLVRYGEKAYPLARVAPSPAQFSHMIVYTNIDGQDLWLDPLEEGIDLGEIPYSLTEERLFIIRPGGGEFIDIPEMPLDKMTYTIKRTFFLESDGSCTGMVESMPNSVNSASLRSTIEDYTAREMDRLKAAMLNRVAAGGKIIDTYITDPKDFSRPFSLMIKFESDSWAPTMGDFMILPSMSPMFENPFDLPEKERDFPVEYYNSSISREIIILNIPKGFHFEYIPKNYEKALPVCKYMLTSQVHNGRLVMISDSHWFPGKIPVKDYALVQDFFIDLQNEARKAIIIKKEEER